jgi:hypothetical protein
MLPLGPPEKTQCEFVLAYDVFAHLLELFHIPVSPHKLPFPSEWAENTKTEGRKETALKSVEVACERTHLAV